MHSEASAAGPHLLRILSALCPHYCGRFPLYCGRTPHYGGRSLSSQTAFFAPAEKMHARSVKNSLGTRLLLVGICIRQCSAAECTYGPPYLGNHTSYCHALLEIARARAATTIIRRRRRAIRGYVYALSHFACISRAQENTCTFMQLTVPARTFGFAVSVCTHVAVLKKLSAVDLACEIETSHL